MLKNLNCGVSDDGPEHILFKCREYDQIKDKLRAMGIYEPKDLKKIVSNDDFVFRFKEICKEIYDRRSGLQLS